MLIGKCSNDSSELKIVSLTWKCKESSEWKKKMHQLSKETYCICILKNWQGSFQKKYLELAVWIIQLLEDSRGFSLKSRVTCSIRGCLDRSTCSGNSPLKSRVTCSFQRCLEQSTIGKLYEWSQTLPPPCLNRIH